MVALSRGSSLFIVVLFSLLPRIAFAESPYCKKVHARAKGDAALLMAPRAIVQGIRFPANGQLDVGATAGNGYQLRAGLAFSPLDFYRGVRINELGDADCERQGAFEALKESLSRAEVHAQVVALKEQDAYLQSRSGEWHALLETADSRLSSQVITLAQFDEVRSRADALDRKLVEVQGETRELSVEGADAPPANLRESTARYVESAAKADREAVRVRALDPWRFQVMGGIIPQAPVDWYGLAEVQFNFGAFEHHHEDDLFVKAQADETAHAAYELPERARKLAARWRASKESAERESDMLDREIAFLARARHALDASEAENVAHARDALAVEQIALESDRVYLRALSKALSPLLEQRQ